MAPSKAKQAQVAARREQLTQLRIEGARFDDPRVLALGYKSPTSASKDMCRTLDRALKREALSVDQYRKLNEQRLLALIGAVWPQAQLGEIPAVEQARKLITDLTKLFGLDMPAKAELSGPGGGPLQLAPADVHALHLLIGMAGEPDADDGDDAYDGEKYEDEDPDATGDDGS